MNKFKEMNEYLGDSVYVKFDGNEVVLYLDNGVGPTDIIHMDPDVLQNFLRFIYRMKEKLEQMES